MFFQITKNSLPLSLLHYSQNTFETSSDDYLEVFLALIKHVVNLRRKGVIDNESLQAVIRQLTATLIENEVSKKVDDVLTNKISKFIEYSS